MFNKRTFLLLFLLIIAIGTVSSVAASDIGDDAVSDSGYDKMEVNENNVMEEATDDDTNQISSVDEKNAISQDASDDALSDNPKLLTELQELVNKAAKGSTITLTSDYYSDSTVESKGVLIDKALTINGNGHTINCVDSKGSKCSRAFYITSDSVVLNDITFTNGYGNKGGAIFIEDCNVIVNNCNFINNTGPYGGGAIITAGALWVNNCNFINNVAQAYNFDSTTYASSPAGFGGAIFAYYPSEGNTSLIITNSYFEYNRASASGGALYLGSATKDGVVRCYDAETYIQNSTFYNNIATYGGAVANFQYCDVYDCQFFENQAMASGGAIHMSNGVFEEDSTGELVFQVYVLIIHGNTVFYKNTASAGGAIRHYADSSILPYGVQGIIRMQDKVVFDSNSAKNGGALYILDALCNIVNAEFKSNTASEGSVIYGGALNDCTFTGNSKPLVSEGNIINTGYTKFTFEQSGTYFNDKTLTVVLANTKYNTPMVNVTVNIKFSNGKSTTVKTNSNGVAIYDVPFGAGTYSATATVSDSNLKVDPVTLTGISIAKAPLSITPTKLSTTYDSGKFFQVKAVNSITSKPLKGIKLKLQVYTGGSSKSVTVTTDDKGIAKYNDASKLSVGTHKVIVSNGQTADCTGSQKTSSIVVSKATYNIIAPKVTNPYKIGNFKITVKNKASGKAVSGVTLTVKVYTGSKAKTQTVKTNSKGIATISTKALSKGNHKIVISTKTTKFYKAASKTSSANIVAKASTKMSYANLTFYCDQDWIDQKSFRTVTKGVIVTAILKDANGNPITKKITMTHSDGNYNIGNSGKEIGVYGGRPGTVTLKFAGDSHYKASSVTIKLGNEEVHQVYY